MTAADARERAARSRLAQGLPPKVTDAQALAAVATLVAPTDQSDQGRAAA